MSEAIFRRLLDPRELTLRDARDALDAMTGPSANDTERAALLVALAARKTRVPELVAFAREMRRRAVPFPVPAGDRAVDLCGSGGARRPSFNISTVSAFVVRAADLKVVKHGNRSQRGCGSSDLLEALGLPVQTSVAFARSSYRRFGLAFLHAPLFHPATGSVATVRRQLGMPTIFNRLGPLSNPARVKCQVSGTSTPAILGSTAAALRDLGVTRGITMSSDDGCDEFSPRGATTAVAWKGPRSRRLQIRPEEFLTADDRSGSWGPLPPTAAAEEARRLLAGGGGARRGSVLLTSGAAVWVAGQAPNLATGIDRAREALDSGRAEALLENLLDLAARYPTDPGP